MNSRNSFLKKGRNIEGVVKSSLCTGCGICAALCPASAITMRKTDSLFVPSVDELKCTECGICLSLCPGKKVEFEKLANRYLDDVKSNPLVGTYRSVFTAVSADQKHQYNASAGGAVTALLESLLESGQIDGALVVKFMDDDPLTPECIIAKKQGDIRQSIGSKYCPVSIDSGVKYIAKNDGVYAVVGLPCHLHGVRAAMAKFPKLEKRIALCIGLFCSGTRIFLAQDYLCRRYGLQKKEIKTFSYRTGDPTGARFGLNDGTDVEIPYVKYNRALKNCFTPPRCNLCIDQYAELADISAGDIHIPEAKREGGVTALVVRSERGMDALRFASETGAIKLEDLDVDMLLRAQRKMALRKKQHVPVRLWIRSRFRFPNPIYDNMTPSFEGAGKWKRAVAYFASIVKGFLGSRKCLWWIVDLLSSGKWARGC